MTVTAYPISSTAWTLCGTFGDITKIQVSAVQSPDKQFPAIIHVLTAAALPNESVLWGTELRGGDTVPAAELPAIGSAGNLYARAVYRGANLLVTR